MKNIIYNPETHALVPREPSDEMLRKAIKIDLGKDCDEKGICINLYQVMLAAAPQPEPVDVWSVGWKHDCAALCANDIELWIDRCPHCGKPRHNHPPTDDELLNKAEPVDVEPAMWVMKHIRSGDLAQAKPNQKALHPRMWSQAHLYTTPQPDRVAELEQLRQRVAELEERRCEVCGYAEHHREHTGCLRKQIEKLTAERDAALARLSEERDIWDGMLGDAADKIAHLELELDDCLYVLDALWDKQCNKIVTQKWAEILIRNKRNIGALSAGDSYQQSTE